MSIFGFFKNQLIDLIEWNQESGSDEMAWRFPRHENEIKNGAQLTVREGQMAIFVDQGKLADVFGPGRHTLNTENIPILTNLKGWKYGFRSPFKAEVYFISTRRFTDLKWGTQNPVTMRDPEFGPVRVRAYGSYAVQVTDPAKMLRQLISTDPQFRSYQISGQLRNFIVTRFADALASSNIPVLDVASNLDELSVLIRQKITPDFEEMGIGVPIFLIENVSLPPNVEAVLDKRTSMGIIGNLDQYMKFQTAEAIPDAAKNPGGVAGAGAGLAMGFSMANQMANAMNPAQPGQPAEQVTPNAMPPPLPPTASTPPWFAAIEGQQVGPINEDDVIRQIQSRKITPETLMWKQGMAAWVPASQVPELGESFAHLPPPLPPPQ